MQNKGNSSSIYMIEKAFSNNRLYEFFTGKENSVNSSYVYLPTDPEFVFNSWTKFVETNRSHSSKYLWGIFSELVEKISTNKDFCWFSIFYLDSFLEYDKKYKIDSINKQLFIDRIIHNVIKFRESLIKDNRWVGANVDNNGLWEYSKRYLTIMKSNYEYDFHLDNIS